MALLAPIFAIYNKIVKVLHFTIILSPRIEFIEIHYYPCKHTRGDPFTHARVTTTNLTKTEISVHVLIAEHDLINDPG